MVGPGVAVFLVALFFAVVGATLFAIAVCRGVAKERHGQDTA
jgi:hypothetical protein